MLKLAINHTTILVTEYEQLTSEREGLLAEFTFNAEWSSYAKVAIFLGSGIVKFVNLTTNIIPVPPECLQLSGGHLFIGVYGTSGTEILPTRFVDIGNIYLGAGPSLATGGITPDPGPTPGPDPEQIAMLLDWLLNHGRRINELESATYDFTPVVEIAQTLIVPENISIAAIDEIGGRTIIQGGAVVSAPVNEIIITRTDGINTSIKIPDIVLQLDGYGQGNPNDEAEYNFLDLISRAYYQLGELNNGIWSTFEEPRVIDLSEILEKEFLQVNAVNEDDVITFVSDTNLDIPVSIRYGSASPFYGGEGIIVHNREISIDPNQVQKKLIAGDNITIQGNIISANLSEVSHSYITITQPTGNFSDEVYNTLIGDRANCIIYNNELYRLSLKDGQTYVYICLNTGSGQKQITVNGALKSWSYMVVNNTNIINHINNTSIHITDAERVYWNNKVNVSVNLADEELVFTGHIEEE